MAGPAGSSSSQESQPKSSSDAKQRLSRSEPIVTSTDCGEAETMMNQKMQNALNKQVNAEMYSSYLYLSMSSYLRSIGFHGMGSWMRAQAEEEKEHAMKIYDHIIEREGRVLLENIEAPQKEWNSPLAVFEATSAHEKKVTGMINDLVNLTSEEKDTQSNDFLQWFVKEQMEEEESADGILLKFQQIGDDKDSLSQLDKELSQR